MNSGTGDPVWRSDSPASRIAIITALEIEAKVPRLMAGEHRPVIYVSGPGQERALAMAELAIARGAEALIAFGLAGGLGVAARTGSVIVPTELLSDNGRWQSDAPWRKRLVDALDNRFAVIEAPLFSANQVVTTAEAKAALASRSGALAVDMESAAVAQAAAEAGKPFVAIRVIADGPGDELPDMAADLVTDDGGTRYRGLLGCLTSLRRLHLLFGLARNSQQARRELKALAGYLVSSAR
jgi:adenosylhomocysteine nucleosidase